MKNDNTKGGLALPSMILALVGLDLVAGGEGWLEAMVVVAIIVILGVIAVMLILSRRRAARQRAQRESMKGATLSTPYMNKKARQEYEHQIGGRSR